LRDVHEYILVFSKQNNKLEKTAQKRNNDTIKKEDFVEWSKSVWAFSAESAKKIGHPAPFPVELPKRVIQFYSYSGNVVLDPFMGSGTTAIAAIKSKRHFIGYEIKEEYVQLAKKRIKKYLSQQKMDQYLKEED
jgi:site-specific DNA-methyltransferase (adenine-specific)